MMATRQLVTQRLFALAQIDEKKVSVTVPEPVDDDQRLANLIDER